MSGFEYLIIDGLAACVSNWLSCSGFGDAWFSYREISVSLSGCLVLLNHPLSYVLDKNPCLVVSADAEQAALGCKGLLLHLQDCPEKATWGEALGCLG